MVLRHKELLEVPENKALEGTDSQILQQESSNSVEKKREERELGEI